MIKRFLSPLAVLALLSGSLLTGCGDDPAVLDRAAADLPPPSPALWQISGKDGTVEGWLFGTIHALPDDAVWRTEAFDKALRETEVLAVEIADLDDQKAIARTFYQLALSPGQPLLADRVSPDRKEKLAALMAKAKLDKGEFQSTETWAAAITLAQLASVGDSENGVDRALIRGFGGGPIIELEGTAKQLGIFDRLPEKEQRDLLNAIIDEGTDIDQQEKRAMVIGWITGNVEQLEIETGKGMLADPELRQALLVGRNADWARKLQSMLPQKGPMMIAVGAAHMAGPDGLPALLGAQGYVISRVQ